MTMPATIGVTGAAGFIGSNLCRRLLDDGRAVIGVDDLSAGNRRNLADCLEHPRFALREMDCRDTLRLQRELAGCEAIVHLAALKIPRYGGALRTLEVNVDGAHAVYDVALASGAHVVLASTSDVYGNAVPPFAEDDPIVLGPTSSRRWSYDVSMLLF
jgi:UDP-glucose 4-epimerase